jgi:hypothetical protein
MRLPILIGVAIFLLPFIVGITIGLVIRARKRRAILGAMERIAAEFGLAPCAPGKGGLQSPWHKGVIGERPVFLQCRNLVYRGAGIGAGGRRNVGGAAVKIVMEVAAKRPAELRILRAYARDGLAPSGERTRLGSFEEAFTLCEGAERISSNITNALLEFVRAHAGGLELRDREHIPAGQIPAGIAAGRPLTLVHNVFMAHLEADPVRPRLEALAALAKVVERAINPL